MYSWTWLDQSWITWSHEFPQQILYPLLNFLFVIFLMYPFIKQIGRYNKDSSNCLPFCSLTKNLSPQASDTFSSRLTLRNLCSTVNLLHLYVYMHLCIHIELIVNECSYWNVAQIISISRVIQWLIVGCFLFVCVCDFSCKDLFKVKFKKLLLQIYDYQGWELLAEIDFGILGFCFRN